MTLCHLVTLFKGSNYIYPLFQTLIYFVSTMSFSDFLSLSSFSTSTLESLLQNAKSLKSEYKNGTEHRILTGKTLAMIFQKPSNRTRVSFEVGMIQLGGHPLMIRPDEIKMGVREPIADVAQVLSRYVNGIMVRALRHTDIVELAKNSSVPVINGLSDLYHPCQGLADMLTILEHKNSLDGVSLCYVGDGNNVCNSLIYAAKLLGVKLTVSCPQGYEPTLCQDEHKYRVVYNPQEAIENADVIYTDVWTSMGQEEELLTRLRVFEKYTITKELFALAKKDAIFMHCLPAHRGQEVDADVIDGPQSVVFDQAENRLHAQKAVLASLLV